MSIKAIIHGHFYQPQMEAPWSNIMVNQESAAPYANWNEKITAECYAPNCFSRILGSNGKINNILNNFEHISFNFGPTLLSYLCQYRKDVYDRIIQADKKSVETHNGHGNGIAQVYSHLIMSLATFEDKKTQIIWALKDFKRRFVRDSEGMWLSECAIDYQTVDLLIEQGVKFIILSPTQAKAVRKIGEQTWYLYDEKNHVDTSVVYRITRAHGNLAVFFYDKDLSATVAFDHLLRDSDNFAHRIMDAGNIVVNNEQPAEENTNEQQEIPFLAIDNHGDKLVTVATDGQMYGHHEPFGDMCLSSMISRYCVGDKQIDLLNFGQFLDIYPPEYEIMIDLGQDNLGSCWSCTHGVGRFYRDCGCNSDNNGFIQGWRTPLREAFDLVKTEADEIFVNQLKKIIGDPFALRNDYIDFILDGYDVNNVSFIRNHQKRDLSNEEIENILQLLHIQRCSMNMYCSYGWFHSDVSSDETIQNLKYAHTTLTLLEEYGSKIRVPFEQKLLEAKSNIMKYGDGKNILQTLIYPKCLDYNHLINNFIAVYRMNKTIDLKQFGIFSSFNYSDLSVEKILDRNNLFLGKIQIVHKRICAPHKFVFIYQILNGDLYRIFICSEKNSDKLLSYLDKICENEDISFDGLSILSEVDLDDEVKSYILEHSFATNENSLINQNIANYGQIRQIAISYKKNALPIPQYLQSQLLASSDAIIEDITNKLDSFPTNDEYKLLIEIFNLLDYFKILPHVDSFKKKITKILISKLSSTDDILSQIYSDAIVLLQFCNQVGLLIERSAIENIVFDILKTKSVQILNILRSIEDEKQRDGYMLQYKKLIIMADVCNINASEERKKMMDYLTDSQIDNPYRF